MRVMFRTDATPRMGAGHVMRCLTLADEIRRQGGQADFLCASLLDPLAERIVASGHTLQFIDSPAGRPTDRPDWHVDRLGPAAQARDAEAALEGAGPGYEWAVVDHYLLGATWETRVRRAAARILVVDDLANRRHDCDMLLDQMAGRDAGAYAALAPAAARLLVGSAYALLRPEFAAARAGALARRRARCGVKRVLIALGMGETAMAGAPIARDIAQAGLDLEVDLIVGAASEGHPELEALRAEPCVRVHVDTQGMYRLMAAADVAIGAAGTTSWERCCLGLPTIMLTLAGNQEETAAALAAAGAVERVATPEAILPSLVRLGGDPAALARMSERAAELIDGKGAPRVVEAMRGACVQ